MPKLWFGHPIAIAIIIVLHAAMVMPAHGQMTTGEKMKDFYAAFELSKGPAQYDAFLTNASEPGCIFYPGDQVKLTFQLQNKTQQAIEASGQLMIKRYGTRSIPGNIWLPQVYSLGDAGKVSFKVNLAANGYQDVTLDVPLPAAFGGYACIVDLGSHGRRFLCTTVRAMRPEIPPTQYPSQALDRIDPQVLERLGVRAVRWGVGYTSSKSREYARVMREVDERMKLYQKYGITVLVEIGAGIYEQPTGRPRTQLDQDGVAKKNGARDFCWLPSEDDDYVAFIKLLTARYGWPKGPMTGIKLWNEPWEGASISGWGADMIRYRELFKKMGQAVHEVNRSDGVDVLTGGCDSSTNTWDKLFPDGSDEFLPYLDFCSIHYQGITAPTLYKSWLNRKDNKGRVLVWDTESWVANSEDRLGSVIATNRALGYDRSMGIYVGNLVTFDNFGNGLRASIFDAAGKKAQRGITNQTWAAGAALCATQALIGERKFNRILFPNGLPWIYLFDGMNGNADDGTVVVIGDGGEIYASPNSMLYRQIRSQSEVMAKKKMYQELAGAGDPEKQKELRESLRKTMPYTGVSMTVQAVAGMSVYDGYGNKLAAIGNTYVIPLELQCYYLRADAAVPGSYAAMVQAIGRGRVEGLTALEMVAHDFLTSLSGDDSFSVDLHNVLNRAISGRLSGQIGGRDISPVDIQLDAFARQTVRVKVRGLKVAADNQYPLHLEFTSPDAGEAELVETMHVNVISRKTITVDGNLEDWRDVLPQVVQSQGAAQLSITESAWLPFKSFDGGQNGGVATGFLAYDDNYFYFAMKAADNSQDEGTLRFAKRDHDADFYPETATYLTNQNNAANRVEVTWPKDVRRFSYRRDPVSPAGCYPFKDNVQIAWNVIPEDQKSDTIANLPGRMPRFAAYHDTDYEYALNTVAPKYGGGFEVWRLLVPGMTRKNFYPRQPAGPYDGDVPGARMITRYESNTRITEAAIPWSEIPLVRQRMAAGEPVKFTFRVNNNTGGAMLELAANRSVSRVNAYTLHVEWRPGWSNEVEFQWEKPK